jgi:hypothetical protein
VAQNPLTPATNPKTEVAQIPNGPNLASEEFVELNLNNLSTLKTSPSSSPLPKSTAAPSASATPFPSAASNANPANPTGSSGLASALLPGAVQVVTGQAKSSVAGIPNNSIKSSPNAGSKPNPEASPGVAVSLNSSQAPANLTKFRKDFYYVLTSYEGDRTLTQAKTIVSDAYLVNLQEGARIQMGAYPKESQAKRVVEQLQQKGISAWIYHP